MKTSKKDDNRTAMYLYYKGVAQSPFYIDHINMIEEYLTNSNSYGSDWKLQMLKALKDVYIEDPLFFCPPFMFNEERETRKNLITNICNFIDGEIVELNLPLFEENIINVPEKSEAQAEEQKIAEATFVFDSNPIFSPELLPEIFNILKNHFPAEQRNELETLLKTGKCNINPLIFLDNGNKLTDAFKKLRENNIITGCEKQDLEKWIALNFNYIFRKENKKFTDDYLDKCISRDGFPCKKPLFEINNGTITRN